MKAEDLAKPFAISRKFRCIVHRGPASRTASFGAANKRTAIVRAIDFTGSRIGVTLHAGAGAVVAEQALDAMSGCPLIAWGCCAKRSEGCSFTKCYFIALHNFLSVHPALQQIYFWLFVFSAHYRRASTG